MDFAEIYPNIIIAVGLFILPFLCALAPMILSRICKKNTVIPLILDILNAFCGGILLCGGAVHLLPETVEIFDIVQSLSSNSTTVSQHHISSISQHLITSKFLQPYTHSSDPYHFPYPYMLFTAGILFFFYLEMIFEMLIIQIRNSQPANKFSTHSNRFLISGWGKSYHELEDTQKPHLRHHSTRVGDEIVEAPQVLPPPPPLGSDVAITENFSYESKVSTGSVIGKSTHISSSTPQSSRVPENLEHHDHLEHQLDALHSNTRSRRALGGFILWLSLTVHSIFEGLALGTLRMMDLVDLLIAVLSHHLIMAFAIGNLLQQGLKNILLILFFITSFSLSIPIGIVIGIFVSSNIDQNLGFLVFKGILLGLSAGVFCFVAFFEILVKIDPSKPVLCLSKLFLFLFGFCLMMTFYILADWLSIAA